MFAAAVYGEYFGYYTWINDAGTRLVFNTEQVLPEMKTNGKDVDHGVMWDIQGRMFIISHMKYVNLNSVIIIWYGNVATHFPCLFSYCKSFSILQSLFVD